MDYYAKYRRVYAGEQSISQKAFLNKEMLIRPCIYNRDSAHGTIIAICYLLHVAMQLTDSKFKTEKSTKKKFLLISAYELEYKFEEYDYIHIYE